MVQPMSGNGWVRITFRDREAADRALDGASRAELSVGGRTIAITRWDGDGSVPAELPFLMDVAAAAATEPAQRRGSRASFSQQRRPTAAQVFEDPAPAPQDLLSEHMPGTKLIVPQQVEFAKKEGWLSGWTNALVGAGGGRGVVATTAAAGKNEGGWTGSLGRSYRYVMDEVVGFKYL